MNQRNAAPMMGSDAAELAWVDVEDLVRVLPTFWESGSERKWLEHAWGVLEAVGLTSYASEVGRMRCVVRVLALWAICWKFCVLISHGGFPDDWRYEIEGASPIGDAADRDLFVLGLLAAQAGDQFGNEWDDMAIGEVVAALVEREHGVVSAALRGRAGDTRLFFELRATGQGTADTGIVPDDVAVAADDHYSADDGVALSWITDGMPL